MHFLEEVLEKELAELDKSGVRLTSMGGSISCPRPRA